LVAHMAYVFKVDLLKRHYKYIGIFLIKRIGHFKYQ